MAKATSGVSPHNRSENLCNSRSFSPIEIIGQIGASFITILSASITYTAPPVYASEIAPVAITETIEGKISRIAGETGIASTTLYNLVKGESNFDPDAVGDKGCSYGLTQQNICANPKTTKEMALDPDTALKIAANDIKNGTQYRYTVCNCFSLVKTKIPSLPKMADVKPNDAPKVGGVIILQYKTFKHIAYITEITPNGVKVLESNYSPCKLGSREVLFTDPHLIGFWSQAMAP